MGEIDFVVFRDDNAVYLYLTYHFVTGFDPGGHLTYQLLKGYRLGKLLF